MKFTNMCGQNILCPCNRHTKCKTGCTKRYLILLFLQTPSASAHSSRTSVYSGRASAHPRRQNGENGEGRRGLCLRRKGKGKYRKQKSPNNQGAFI